MVDKTDISENVTGGRAWLKRLQPAYDLVGGKKGMVQSHSFGKRGANRIKIRQARGGATAPTPNLGARRTQAVAVGSQWKEEYDTADPSKTPKESDPSSSEKGRFFVRQVSPHKFIKLIYSSEKKRYVKKGGVFHSKPGAAESARMQSIGESAEDYFKSVAARAQELHEKTGLDHDKTVKAVLTRDKRVADGAELTKVKHHIKLLKRRDG